MFMQISIMNFKGGEGKSSIALNLSYTYDYGIVVNETYSVLKKHLDEDHLLIVPGDIPKNLDDVIYDFGGGITKYMQPVLERSDIIIIPFVVELLDMEVTLECIHSILSLKLGDKVVLVPNLISVEDKSYPILLETLKEYEFDHLPLCPIRKSAAVKNIFVEHRTVAAMQAEGGLNGFNYRKVNKDFNNLINLINTKKG